MNEDISRLEEAILNLKKKDVIDLTKKVVAEKSVDANGAVEAVTRALNRVGALYQEGDYFLPELIYAGDMAKIALDILQPFIQIEKSNEKDAVRTIILGTVKGDMHDLGKNIVGIYAEGAGYEIIDLGKDVSVERFIETLKKHNAKILGLSCLLTACDRELYKIADALKKEGLGDVKIVIGGAAMTEEVARDLEKESKIVTRFAADAITGIKIFDELIDG
ncbi:MAG: B12-binding domain-containing protein [Promethearchaeota archaeon]